MPARASLARRALLLAFTLAGEVSCATSHVTLASPDGGLAAMDAGADAPELTAESFIDAYQVARCAWSIECEPRRDPWGAATLEALDCHPAPRALEREGIVDALAAGRLVFDETAARACLSVLTSRSCAWPVACERIGFAPGVARAGVCNSDLECPATDRCGGDVCPRRCVPRAELGDGCITTLASCGADLVCLYDPTGEEPAACVARLSLGESCHAWGPPCERSLSCREGRCAPRGIEGERCAFSDDCDRDLVCGGTTELTCQIGAALDEPCSVAAPCSAGARCVLERCERIAEPEGACGPDITCPFGFACRDAICAPLPLAGESCAWAGSCLEGSCVGARCALADSGPCALLPPAPPLPLAQCAGRCSAVDAGTCVAPGALGEECYYPWRLAEQCEVGLVCRQGDDGVPRCLPDCG